MVALTVYFRKHSGPTPADDMAAQIMNLDLRTVLFVNNKHLIYIQSWPKISAPLVNMIKEGCVTMNLNC